MAARKHPSQYVHQLVIFDNALGKRIAHSPETTDLAAFKIHKAEMQVIYDELVAEGRDVDLLEMKQRYLSLDGKPLPAGRAGSRPALPAGKAAKRRKTKKKKR